MFSVRELNISVEIWGAAFCAIGIACVMLLMRGGGRYRALLASMFFFEFASAGGDAIAGLYRGQEGTVAWLATHVGNSATFICGFLLLAAFTSYLDMRLNEADGKDRAVWVRLVWIVSSILCLMALIGVFYYIDEGNVYHRTDWHWVSLAYVVLVDSANAVLVLRSRTALDRLTLACLLFYVLTPIPAVLIQMFIYGLNFTMIASVIGLIVVFLEMQVHSSRMLMKRNEELAQSRVELSESRIAVMVSQIQPHFLFNTLDSIYYLCDEDPSRAKQAIDGFSSYLRANLDSLNQTGPVAIETELTHVSTYLELEKISMEELLEYEIGDEVGGFSVPALSVQTLVENAVKHGIGKKPGGGKVVVSTSETDDCYLVSIVDDGVGFVVSDDTGAGSVGIRNTETRLSAMCGGGLEIASEPGVGTTAVIRIPKESLT